MLISYKWLQSYFEEKLPSPEKLAELLTFSFAEVECIEKKEEQPPKATPLGRGETTPALADSGTPFGKGDTIFDIKVLPDRACYALSHRGVAYEVSAITGFPRKVFNWPQPEIGKVRSLSVRVEAPELCLRYTARVIENVTAKTLSWVAEHLGAVGQRSINPIVDGANIVMLDRGQPLHAFDADKVKGAIVVRFARQGEKITTLDNREVALDETVLVIADEEAPLAIAGIKGGKRAEVTAATKNLILESANFNAVQIRKTAERLGIRTDASKRFENRLSPELARTGIDDFTAYLFEMDKGLSTGEIVDIRHSHILQNVRMSVTPRAIAEKLGLAIGAGEIERVLNRLEIQVEKTETSWILTPPSFRLDLAIPEDIAEEVGRIIGYDKIPAKLPEKSAEILEIPRSFYREWKIREALVRAGFSEIMTSSFSDRGDAEIEKPLAEDKKYARLRLRDSFERALTMNALNAPLFGTDIVKIFEIGKVFTTDGERTALALGVSGPKKKITRALSEAREMLARSLGTALSGEEKGGVFECNLDEVIEKLPLPASWDISLPAVQGEKFMPFSLYPFIVRDIALFVSPLSKGVAHSDAPGVVSSSSKGVPTTLPESEFGTPFNKGDSARAGVVSPVISPESVHTLLQKEAGPLLVRSWLFDRFEKDGKTSYAFRLVFQTPERTLTDAEVNSIMKGVYSTVKKQGWSAR